MIVIPSKRVDREVLFAQKVKKSKRWLSCTKCGAHLEVLDGDRYTLDGLDEVTGEMKMAHKVNDGCTGHVIEVDDLQ